MTTRSGATYKPAMEEGREEGAANDEPTRMGATGGESAPLTDQRQADQPQG